MIQEFLTYASAIRGNAANTVTAYGKDLKEFATWAQANLQNPRWSAITRTEIDAYIEQLTREGKGASTTNRKLSSISELYKYMMRQGYDIQNPCRYETRKKIARTQPNTISMAQLYTAYQHAAGTAKLMLGILMDTGIRIQELLDIRKEDIDQQTNAIRITGKGSKQRTVYMRDETMTAINQLRPQQYGKIFEQEQREARRIIFEALRPYSNAKQLSPHAIRHTYATHLANRGVNVSTLAKILGHDSIKTTQRYIDMSLTEIEETMADHSLLN